MLLHPLSNREGWKCMKEWITGQWERAWWLHDILSHASKPAVHKLHALGVSWTIVRDTILPWAVGVKSMVKSCEGQCCSDHLTDGTGMQWQLAEETSMLCRFFSALPVCSGIYGYGPVFLPNSIVYDQSAGMPSPIPCSKLPPLTL